ncbi:MAG: efflux RND transporter permease subunit [Thiotrichales bacterium]|nr:efflux RND transporter permease subunit [Thiotrichales bacterium]
MPLIRFSINNPLIVNLSLVIILIMGVLSWRELPQEIFPVVDLDMVHINTEFEGASPAEVEQQVTLPLEEEFEDSQDIDYISSISNESLSSIYIKLKPGSNVDDFMRDARTILDSIDDLPEIAEEPELNRIRTRFPVITLTLFGEISNARLYEMAEEVRRRMQEIEGVASVGMAGDREWEIWVTLDPHRLAAMNVSLDSVLMALRNNLVDQPGGSIKSSEGDIRLRGKGVEPDPEAIEEIVLRANKNGGQLLLGQIAKIERRFEEAVTYARLNGKPSVNLTATKTASASTIKVSERIKELSAELRQTLPVSLNVSYHTDMSRYVKTRLNTVKSSGLIGLMLVLLSLYLLLNFRVALITALGIPVSFLVAIILLFYFGYTINMVSLFAFLIVLGMIVDDAIIVTENVYRHMEQGMERFRAAYIGATEVYWPVVVSTLTTIAAFLPMFAIGSTLGEFIKVIPVVVCCALLGSLIEAFAVLPAHAGHYLKVRNTKNPSSRWKVILNHYCRLLHWSALNRYFVAVLSIGILAFSLTYAKTRLPFQMFGHVEIGQFFVNLETPNTYSLEDTLELATRLESRLMELIDDEDELDTLLTNVGITFIDFNRFKFGSNLIQFVVDLEKPVPQGFIENWVSPVVSLEFERSGTRERSAQEIIDVVRQEITQFPGVQRMSILKPDAGPAGADIEVGIVSTDIDLLQDKADELRDYLRSMSGVNDVRHDQEPGKLEYKYELNDRGKQLGLTQSQLANVVRSGFLGNEIVHVTWNEHRIPVRVIFPEALREQSSRLATLPIVLGNGEKVYLGDVADISIDRGLNEIRRRDSQRMAKITAEVDGKITTPLEVTAQIEEKFSPRLEADNYNLLFLGEKKDADESFEGMFQALAIALAVIFFMLTALFKSLIDPLVVMIAIPFGIIGVVFGHALFDYNLQFLSVVGMLALSGIIVNDSLILVDFIKRLRNAGEERIKAVVEAGRVRARPILLTTITTFLGVSPLIFFATGQTAFLSPMAVSLGFGLVFATVLILLTLPCLYLIADDFRTLLFGVPAPKRKHLTGDIA